MDKNMESDIGGRLRILRKSLGMKQRDFAEALEVAPLTISRMENGQRFPDAELMRRLATRFQCDLNWLVTGSETVASSSHARIPLVTNFAGDLEKLSLDSVEDWLAFPGAPAGAIAFICAEDGFAPMASYGDTVIFAAGNVSVGGLAVVRNDFGNVFVRRRLVHEGQDVFIAANADYQSAGRLECLGPVWGVVKCYGINSRSTDDAAMVRAGVSALLSRLKNQVLSESVDE